MKRPLFLITALTAALALAGCNQAEESAASADADQVTLSADDTGSADANTLTPGADDETQAAAAEPATLNGSLSYRERMALPEDSLIIVQLLDVSLADAPAEILAEKHLMPEGQVPVEFSLAYDPAEVEANHRYALRGEIRGAEGELLWTTTEHQGVDLSDAAPEAQELVLTRVAEPEEVASETEAAPEATTDETDAG